MTHRSTGPAAPSRWAGNRLRRVWRQAGIHRGQQEGEGEGTEVQGQRRPVEGSKAVQDCGKRRSEQQGSGFTKDLGWHQPGHQYLTTNKPSTYKVLPSLNTFSLKQSPTHPPFLNNKCIKTKPVLTGNKERRYCKYDASTLQRRLSI